MTSVYLVARYEWQAQMREVADKLAAAEIQVTSRWIRGLCDEMSGPEAAELDLEDIDRADCLVLFSDPEGGAGRHIEFGYALGKGKRLFIVGQPESVFHFLRVVIVCPTVTILIRALGRVA